MSRKVVGILNESEKLIKAAQEYKSRHSRFYRFCPSLCTPISAASCGRSVISLVGSPWFRVAILAFAIIWIPFKVVQGCNRVLDDVDAVGKEVGTLVISWAESWAEEVQKEAREARADLTAITLVKYNSLRIGMSYSEVIAIFGDPTHLSSNGHLTATWEQYAGGRPLNIVFAVFENMKLARYYSHVSP